MKIYGTLADFSVNKDARCGNGWGFANHTVATLTALEMAGCTITPDLDEADAVLHTGPPHMCHAIDGKINIAHTCWEASDVPPNFSGPLAAFDGVSVTATFLVAPFREALLGLGADIPVVYIPDGVDSRRFRYVDRLAKDYKHKPKAGKTPMRFLWLGAPNRRKGGEQVIGLWKAFSEHPKFSRIYGNRVELYIKTSVPDGESRGLIHSKAERIIYDDRRVSEEELVRIYQRSHCFVFPSIGEGFGFTMAEAMATGLPVIYTPATAMIDLAPALNVYPDDVIPPKRKAFGAPWSSDYGYPVDFAWEKGPWEWDEKGKEKISMMVTSAMPDINDLFRKVVWVADHWVDALERGRRGADRIREQFRWSSTGKQLRDFIHAVIAQRARKPTQVRSAT